MFFWSKKKEVQDNGIIFLKSEKEVASFLGKIHFSGAEVTGCGMLGNQATLYPYFWINESDNEKLDDLIVFIKEYDCQLMLNVCTTTIKNITRRNSYKFMIRFEITVLNELSESKKLIFCFNAHKYGDFLKIILTTGRICILFREPVPLHNESILEKIMDEGHLTFQLVETPETNYKYVYNLLDKIKKLPVN